MSMTQAEEAFLRNVVRQRLATLARQGKLSVKTTPGALKAISEAATKVKKGPHKYTAMNVLETLLKTIVPNIEENYKSLTTSTSQRESFVAHVMASLNELLTALKTNRQPEYDEEEKQSGDLLTTPVNEAKSNQGEKVNISIKPEKIQIKGKDETGRNFAIQTYKQIESAVRDSFVSLNDQKDITMFEKYLFKNLILYFEKFERELQTMPSAQNRPKV